MAAKIVNFLMRALLGGISIYVINQILVWQNLNSIIAINPLTVLTSGILGFPGVVLLYAINFMMLV